MILCTVILLLLYQKNINKRKRLIKSKMWWHNVISSTPYNRWKLLTLPGQMSLTTPPSPNLVGFVFAQSLAWCVVFWCVVNIFSLLSLGHYIACLFSICGLYLPLWYIQSFLSHQHIRYMPVIYCCSIIQICTCVDI